MKKVTTSRAGVTKRRRVNPVERGPLPGSEQDYAGLVRAAAGGDRSSMERLLMQAQEVAWRFSLTVCGHADDAEDVMQEALIKTYRHAGQIRDPDAFRPWLYRTVRNACLMGRRKKAHEPAHMESLDEPGRGIDETDGRGPADPGRSPEQLVGDSDLRARLGRALRALPGPYRAIVFLREMEGLSTRDVATVMGISEDNVKTRLHRARAALQAELGKQPR